MKKVIFTLMVFLFAQKLFAQERDTANNFTIKGALVGAYSGILYLAYTDSQNNYVLDSTILKNGNFKFTRHVSAKTVAWFKAKTKFRFKEDMLADSLRTMLSPGQTITALLYSEDVE